MTISQLQNNRLDFTYISFFSSLVPSACSQTLSLCLHLLLDHQLTTDFFLMMVKNLGEF